MSSYSQGGPLNPLSSLTGEKVYSRVGGAFEFEVSTSFRDINDVPTQPTEEELLIYESNQDKKKAQSSYEKIKETDVS